MGHRGWGHVRKLPSGRFQASYTDPNAAEIRHYASMTYTAREDADQGLTSERRDVELGRWVAPALRRAEAKIKSETVGDYAKRWIAERKLRLRHP